MHLEQKKTSPYLRSFETQHMCISVAHSDEMQNSRRHWWYLFAARNKMACIGRGNNSNPHKYYSNNKITLQLAKATKLYTLIMKLTFMFKKSYN